MSLVDLTVAVSPGALPKVLDLPGGTWISPGNVSRLRVEAVGPVSVSISDTDGNTITVPAGDPAVEFAAPNGAGFIPGAIIVDATAGPARISWVGR